jgi:hypothetical protein
MVRKFGAAGALVALGRLTFMVFVVIAGRTMTPTGFGQFMVVLVGSQILALIASLGTAPSAQVMVSDAVARNRPALVLGYIRFAGVITTLVSLAVAAVLTAVSLALRAKGWIDPAKDVTIPIALLLFPMAMSWLREYVARALGSSVLAFTPRDVGWTGLMSVLLLVFPGVAANVIGWAAGTLLAVEAVAWLLVWSRYLRPIRHRGRDISALYGTWFRHAVAMLFNTIVGFSFERIDTFAISAFTSLAVAGAYAAASRVAAIVAISQRFVVPVVLPNIVAALSRGDMPRARSEIRHGILTSLAFALPVYLAIMLFAEPIMGIFGPLFRPYANVLRILATAQFGLAVNGPIGAALTGNSPYIYARFGWIALTTTALLLVTLTPLFGAVGAALAVMLGIGLQVTLIFLAVNMRFTVIS